MTETLDYLRTFAAFPFALRRFNARPRLTLDAAERTIRERMQRREENFLTLVERGVFASPSSPYLALFREAGCESGDVRALIKDRGLDEALKALRDAGVYVKFEEFKGRKPIKRGRLELPVRGRDFDNPLPRRDLMMSTGGTTGAAHSVAIDLDNLADRAVHRLVVLAAHGVDKAPVATLGGAFPSLSLRGMIYGAYVGNIPERWFSPFGMRDSRQWVKYAFGTYYLISMMRLSGLRVPFPQYATPDQPLEIVRWAAQAVKNHGKCLIRTTVSQGARLGLTAQGAGIDLTGTTFTGAGEPPTPMKVEQMTRAGARYVTTYGSADAGMIGQACARSTDASDVHVFKDAFALTTHPHHVERFDVTVPAFSVTSLLPSTAKLLINVELDDYGIVEERSCGCPLEAYGYSTHVRQIRSYSKLTGEGVTLIGSEVQRVLEEELPRHFGGTPLDYQLLEDEDETGLTRLYLLVHPRLSIADEAAVARAMLDGLARSSPMADAARIVWQNLQTIRVKREEPIWSSRGKLLPLHIRRIARG